MKRIKTLMIITIIVAAVVVAEYIDYTIYKAKYPNTTLWMWVMDSK
jgi:hypothetical protein